MMKSQTRRAHLSIEGRSFIMSVRLLGSCCRWIVAQSRCLELPSPTWSESKMMRKSKNAQISVTVAFNLETAE